MLFTVTALLGFSSTPGSIEGCFNYYTGSCQGCGEPDMPGLRRPTHTALVSSPSQYVLRLVLSINLSLEHLSTG